MTKGAKYKFYIPANLGYGEMGAPGGQIGPNQALEFEVELIDFKRRASCSTRWTTQVRRTRFKRRAN